MNQGELAMGNAQWTDDFLEGKRQQADPQFDANIKAILDADFLDEKNRGLFAGWVKSQGDLIAEAVQIAGSLPGEDDLPPATIRKIDQLYLALDRQYGELEKWRWHIWPPEFQFHIDGTRLATLLACKALANRQLEIAVSAMNGALKSAVPLAKHFEELSARVAAEPGSREQIGARNLAAYNRFLQITQNVRDTPDLFLCDGAFRKAQFKSYPTVLQDTFTPTPCPVWVDEEKLRTGFNLWREHMPACVMALFVHSLPACYLDRKGIPLLYRTERLLKQEFLAQRIYETGFFLKDVMDEGGLSVVKDTGAMHTAWFAAAVHKFRPDLTFEFGTGLDPRWSDAQGKILGYPELLRDPRIQREYEEQSLAAPVDYTASDLGAPGFERLFRDCLQRNVDFQGRRLWGRGFQTATKVRYLHASMRYMALKHLSDDEIQKTIRENGRPVNQEDMAFVLLTIGYVIPFGVEKLGGILSRTQKEAFLHCWKVVGHIMGIGDDLLTDDWDEAKALYEKIKDRQKGTSDNGVKLNNALCTLIETLLPPWMPFRSAMGPVWIRDQMGEDADLLFDATHKAASRNLLVRGCWAFGKHVLVRGYFLSRHWFFDGIPPARAAIDAKVQLIANSMIECFKQTYERERFDLFPQLIGDTANPGTTKAEQDNRTAIRARLFTWAMAGVCLVLLFHPFFWIGVASLLISFLGSTHWFGPALISIGWGEPAANAMFWSMFWLCIIDLIGFTLIERKLKGCLQELAFKVPAKFLL